MSKFPFIFLFIPFLVLAENQEKDFRLQQQSQLNQQRQEQQFIQQDKFFTTLTINNQEFEVSDNIEEIMTTLFLAINYKQTNDIQHLLIRYKQFPQAEQGMILFAEANIAFNQGNTKKAIQLYEQLIQQEPDFTRGKLDLAKLYFFNWQNNQSQTLFQQISLPQQPNVMNRVKQFLSQIALRQSWHGSFSLGGIYNSNLNQSGNETTKEIVDNPYLGKLELTRTRPKIQKGYGLSYELGLSKYHALKEHNGFIFKGYFYGELYPKKSEFTEHNISLGLGYRFKDQSNQFDLYPVFEKTYAYRDWYSERKGINLIYSKTINSDFYFSLQTEYKWEKYQDKTLSHHNGKILSLYPTVVYNLPNNWILFGGIDYLLKYSTESKINQYNRKGIRFGINKYFQIGIELTAQAIFRNTNYAAYNALLGKTRRDREQKYLFTISLPKFSFYDITPSINLTHTIHQSNAKMLYRYKQSEIVIKLEKTF
ncbi:TPA: porin family protein [Haemophilus influenzae]